MQAVFPLVIITNPLLLPPTHSAISAQQQSHTHTHHFSPDTQLPSVLSGKHLCSAATVSVAVHHLVFFAP